jgi:hypothetical protein
VVQVMISDTDGRCGPAPPERERLVIGHESVGRVRDLAGDARFPSGDLVVGAGRRPDPVPCAYCAIGEWDMCRNGRYTERGIKERDGYGSERFRVEPHFAVKVRRHAGDELTGDALDDRCLSRVDVTAARRQTGPLRFDPSNRGEFSPQGPLETGHSSPPSTRHAGG